MLYIILLAAAYHFIFGFCLKASNDSFGIGLDKTQFDLVHFHILPDIVLASLYKT